MPRDKSELTKNAKIIGIRLIPRHKAEWDKLGGVNWLRELLQKRIDGAKNDV